jgi:ribonuclease Z
METPDAVCYIVQLADYPGKFDAAKAKALGVPAGPLFGRLKAGEAVTLADGRVVDGRDLVAPPTPGAAVLVVDCPGPQHWAEIRALDWTALAGTCWTPRPSPDVGGPSL